MLSAGAVVGVGDFADVSADVRVSAEAPIAAFASASVTQAGSLKRSNTSQDEIAPEPVKYH
jgi:hypothetical protein